MNPINPLPISFVMASGILTKTESKPAPPDDLAVRGVPDCGNPGCTSPNRLIVFYHPTIAYQ